MPSFVKFAYTVEAEVTFTKEEYLLLIELAKMHYDYTCQNAGLKGGEYHPKRCSESRENGFLVQLEMFPTTPEYTTTVWPFRNFDITMKILEQRHMMSYSSTEILNRIFVEISKIMHQIQDEHMALCRRQAVGEFS
jgi:hypothetical protein